MWQDALVTIVALGAVGALAWRWYAGRKRKASAPSCANCAVSDGGQTSVRRGSNQGQTTV